VAVAAAQRDDSISVYLQARLFSSLLRCARPARKLAAVYRVHTAPRVYGVSRRLTPGKPPDRRTDGGRWGGGIGARVREREREREKDRGDAIHARVCFLCLGARRRCIALAVSASSARRMNSPARNIKRVGVTERLISGNWKRLEAFRDRGER